MSARIDNAQSVVSAMRELDGNAVFNDWVDVLAEALDYAGELESRLKSCNSCRHNSLDSPCCDECWAEGNVNNHYPLWELSQ